MAALNRETDRRIPTSMRSGPISCTCTRLPNVPTLPTRIWKFRVSVQFRLSMRVRAHWHTTSHSLLLISRRSNGLQVGKQLRSLLEEARQIFSSLKGICYLIRPSITQLLRMKCTNELALVCFANSGEWYSPFPSDSFRQQILDYTQSPRSSGLA